MATNAIIICVQNKPQDKIRHVQFSRPNQINVIRIVTKPDITDQENISLVTLCAKKVRLPLGVNCRV